MEVIDANCEGNSTNAYAEHYYINKSMGLLIDYFSNQRSGNDTNDLDKQALVKTNIIFMDVLFARSLLIISSITTFIAIESLSFGVMKSRRSKKMGG